MNTNQNLIVFLIPPLKLVNGGILSIFSIAQVSRQFKSIHKSEVVIATPPGEKSYGKNDLFENNETIYSFDTLVDKGSPSSLLLHIPEYASYDVFMTLWNSKKYMAYIARIKDFRVNILNQNIKLMQPPHEVANWYSLTPHITMTIAHNRYSTQEIADTYNLSTRHLSTFVDQSQYKWVPYEKKEKLIVLSPDETPQRPHIVTALTKAFPDYNIVTIRNMSYEAYKDTMSRARFAITFGEGFDGYYVEAFFSRGMAFAVYNEEFFPDKSFAAFDNNYASYDDMLARITDDIVRLDTKSTYEKIVNRNLEKINQYYSFKKYTDNIRQYYAGNYSFSPQHPSAEKLVGAVARDRLKTVANKDRMIAERDKAITGMEKMIAEKSEHIAQLDARVASMEHSQSWRITRPLRRLSALIRQV